MQHDGRLPQIRACPSSRENDLDASEEVEVIKAILQREGYMDRARSQIASPGSQFSKNQGALDDLITTLDLLRSATLDTVEATAQWRRAQGHTNPFIWGGMNYLLKIPTDLNFLDEYKVSHRYLFLVFALIIFAGILFGLGAFLLESNNNEILLILSVVLRECRSPPPLIGSLVDLRRIVPLTLNKPFLSAVTIFGRVVQ